MRARQRSHRLPYRRPALALPLLMALPLLGGIAAVMAIYKPF